MEQQRWQHIYLARLADQAKRYDDVVEEMKKIARMDVQLTLEERNLLSLGYKNVTGSKRVSWHLFSSSVEKEAAKGHEQNLKKMEDYRHKVEDELTRICEDVLSLVDDHLLPSSSTPESTVFFYKMKGDHCRYLAETKVGNDRKEATDQSLKAYEAGTRIATSNLPPTHQVRLGLALNFSVFYYDILDSPERACLMAREAFDEAIPELDSLNEESYKDSTHVLQLIRDNLTLWTPEEGDGSSKLAGEQS